MLRINPRSLAYRTNAGDLGPQDSPGGGPGTNSEENRPLQERPVRQHESCHDPSVYTDL